MFFITVSKRIPFFVNNLTAGNNFPCFSDHFYFCLSQKNVRFEPNNLASFKNHHLHQLPLHKKKFWTLSKGNQKLDNGRAKGGNMRFDIIIDVQIQIHWHRKKAISQPIAMLFIHIHSYTLVTITLSHVKAMSAILTLVRNRSFFFHKVFLTHHLCL